MMKAILCTAYGPPEVLELSEIEKPIPRNNEVLIRIRATTVTAADCEIRRFEFPGWIWLPLRLWFGLRRPRRPVLGQELAGNVEAVGKDVKLFVPGDWVFASSGIGLGAYAEYICLGEEPEGGAIAKIPASLSVEEAATIPYGGREALQFLRKGNIQSGQKVLINGAGGSFGTYAVQLAKIFGADVTAVDSAGKLDMLRSIGADHVIDYTQQSFTSSGETYDVVFDVPGKSLFLPTIKSLGQNGRFLLSNPHLTQLVLGLWISMTTSKKVIFGASSGTSEDLAYLGDLVAAGKIRSIIDRSYPLERMAEAHKYVETGQKKGSVVITVEGSR